MTVLPDAENHTIISSFVWTKHWNVTDGQTDRIGLATTVVCEQCRYAVILSVSQSISCVE